MGKIEKLVVLAVLLVSAVVVSVSIYGSGDAGAHEQPFGANNVAQASDRADSKVTGAADSGSAQGEQGPHSYIQDETWDSTSRTSGKSNGQLASQERGGLGVENAGGRPSMENETAGDTTSDLLLSASSSAPDSSAAAASSSKRPSFDDAGRPLILRSDADVIDSSLPGYAYYEASQGDTWTSIARDLFVGGTKHRKLLLNQNESLMTPTVGAKIAIPIYDYAARSNSRKPHDPRAVAHGTMSRDELTSADSATKEVQPVRGQLQDGWYVVAKGDTLSDISKKVYGTATRWREIYQANKTRMSGPDWVDVGVRLLIP